MKILIDFLFEEICFYIDWFFFFMIWELKGKYLKIFDDFMVGEIV